MRCHRFVHLLLCIKERDQVQTTALNISSDLEDAFDQLFIALGLAQRDDEFVRVKMRCKCYKLHRCLTSEAVTTQLGRLLNLAQIDPQFNPGWFGQMTDLPVSAQPMHIYNCLQPKISFSQSSYLSYAMKRLYIRTYVRTMQG